MSVVLVGLDHRMAPLELLEKVAIADHDLDKVVADLRGYANFSELVVLSTCLRTEIYAVVERFHDAVSEITDALADHAGLTASSLGTSLTIAYDYDVATHLFSVASGLESSVPGETEVLGQVRRAHERALEDQVSGPILNELFRSAVHAGKRVRTETPISRGATSFAQAAVAMAADHLGGSFAGKTIALVGAGDLGAGVIEAIVSRDPDAPPAAVLVANRTIERATELIGALDAPSTDLRAMALEDLSAALNDVDLLVAAIDADGFLLTYEDLSGRERPLLIVDLGVPRNIDPMARSLDEVSLVDVSDLGRRVKATLESRRDEIDAANRIVNDEVHRYRDVARARGAAPVVASLRSRFEELRTTELERRRSEFSDLDDEQWLKIDALTKSMFAKVLHEPTVVVRDTAGTPRGERLVDALRTLFGC